MTERAFDPRPHLTAVRGAQYLEVRWRIAWLRAEHPEARVSTELVEHDRQAGYALVRATVEVPGGGAATGYGSESAADWRDYVEKAETKAVGRALALLGYGTQFALDLEGEGGAPVLADAPVEARPAPAPARPSARAGLGATEAQLRALHAIGRRRGLDHEALGRLARERYGVDALEALDRQQASALIDQLQGQASEEPAPVTDWHSFWTWARGLGYESKREVEELTGLAVTETTPQELQRALLAARGR